MTGEEWTKTREGKCMIITLVVNNNVYDRDITIMCKRIETVYSRLNNTLYEISGNYEIRGVRTYYDENKVHKVDIIPTIKEEKVKTYNLVSMTMEV